MAPTVSCRGGLMELRLPSRKLMQLSNNFLCLKKTKPKPTQIYTKHPLSPPPTWNGYMTQHLQSGQQTCLWPSWAFAFPPSSQLAVHTVVPPRAQAQGHGLCWGSWPAEHCAQPFTDPALAAQSPQGKLNTSQLLILKLDKVIQNRAHIKEFTLGYSPENCINLDKVAIQFLLLVKGSFCHLIAHDNLLVLVPIPLLRILPLFPPSLYIFSSLLF